MSRGPRIHVFKRPQPYSDGASTQHLGFLSIRLVPAKQETIILTASEHVLFVLIK